MVMSVFGYIWMYLGMEGTIYGFMEDTQAGGIFLATKLTVTK